MTRRMTPGRRSIAGVVFAAAVALGGCAVPIRPVNTSSSQTAAPSSIDTGAPVFRAAPDVNESGPCLTIDNDGPNYPAQPDYYSSNLVQVDPTPSAVIERWLPGYGDPGCAITEQRGTSRATALADAVRAAPGIDAAPDAVFSCPFDAGSALELYFRYPGSTDVEYVVVKVRGCDGIGAPGRGARKAFTINDLLLPDVPAGWLGPFHS